MEKRNHRVITDYIRKNYASIARRESQGSCCGGDSCCTNKTVDIEQLSKTLGYEQSDMTDISENANLGLGCGNPLAHASIKEGEVVLDLGSGGGFDCFIARRQVGENGRVIGVDMTSEMNGIAPPGQALDPGGFASAAAPRGGVSRLTFPALTR